MTVYEELARLGSATVYEAAGRVGLVDVRFEQIVPGSRAAGPARTVLCGQDDNLMVHAAMALVEPGDVLVLTMPTARPVALVGDLLATQAQVRGAAAILVDAAVRDAEELARLGLPIWARYVSIRGADKTSVGSLDAPVAIGGQAIRPGDCVILDADGVAIVPAASLEATRTAAREREQAETKKRRLLEQGALTYDLDDLRARVEGR